MSNTNTFFDDISCTRAVLVISIVLGHSFAIYTGSNARPLPEGVSFLEFYKYINPAVISFHLQGFVFIAGFLFGAQMNMRVIGNLPFVLKKAKRILLPMLIFGFLYIFLFLLATPEYPLFLKPIQKSKGKYSFFLFVLSHL